MSGKTVIRVRCDDQALKITEAPTLASGGLNEAVVAFAFCDKWNGFAKTGVFYRNDDEPYYAVLDENDTCVVPWEVYAEPGYFSFSVFGDKDDIRRTSVSLKYKVVKGINASAMMPSDPSPDVYDQIMAEVAAANAKANELWEAAENGEFDGERGEKGDKGDTPVVGIDFYTPEEQTAIKDDMLSQIGIKQTASGTSLTLRDSSDCKLQAFSIDGGTAGETVSIEVSGKNFINPDNFTTDNKSDGSPKILKGENWVQFNFTGVHADPYTGLNGTNQVVDEKLLHKLPYLTAGTYTLSVSVNQNEFIGVFAIDEEGKKGDTALVTVQAKNTTNFFGEGEFTLKAPTRITIRRTGTSSAMTIFYNLQLERGSEPTDYEPYRTPQAVTVEATGGKVDVLEQHPGLRSYHHTTVISNDRDIPMDVTYVADTKTYIDKKLKDIDNKLTEVAAALL